MDKFDEQIISLTKMVKKIQQLETYNKKLLTENTKYASESNELAVENKRLNEIVRDQATAIAKKMGLIIKLEKALGE